MKYNIFKYSKVIYGDCIKDTIHCGPSIECDTFCVIIFYSFVIKSNHLWIYIHMFEKKIKLKRGIKWLYKQTLRISFIGMLKFYD